MKEIIHAVNRGVDKRELFIDDQDYLRFIHDLFEFNNQERVNTNFYYFQKAQRQSHDLRGREIGGESRRSKEKRKLLVNILAFCLMPTHYHLLLMPKVEQGVPRFMQKLNAGYVKYFNERYERKGTLFESGYKAVAIKNEAHFIHIPYYIHLNPLDLEFPKWRNREIENYKEAMRFLVNYRWSSFPDYIGKKNFPSVTQREFLFKFFNGPNEYKKETIRWLKNLSPEDLNRVALK